VVAFALLLAVPLGCAEAADVAAGRRKAEPCAACHGPGGTAAIPGTPSLSAMPAFYTHWQLNMYRDGRRRDPQMTPFAERLSDEDMADLSAYFAAQAAGPPRSAAAVDPARAAAGRPLAESLHCTSCHGPTLMGQQAVPRVAGQDLAYLDKRLRGYKSRTTSDLDGQMTMIAQPLSDADIAALVHFMAGLSPRPAPAAPGAPGTSGAPADSGAPGAPGAAGR
jgi:cytochrome c553